MEGTEVSNIGKPERATQDRVIALLRDELGYRYLGDWAGLSHRQLVLSLRPNTGEARRGEILDAWYRAQVRAAMPALLARWEPLMGVKVDRFFCSA